MNRLKFQFGKLHHWLLEKAGPLLRKKNAIHVRANKRQEILAWWKKDLGELVSDLKRLRDNSGSSISLEKFVDIARWTVRTRVMVLSVFYILVLSVSIILLCTETFSEIRHQNHERQVLESRYLRYAGQVDLLPLYQAQSDIILERFGGLLDAIPGALESVHVLTQVNKAAKESGLYLEFFKPAAEEMHTYYVVLPVEIRLRGDYNGIARFLELVSGMKHLVTVDVVILPSGTHENQIVLASLLKAYRYKDSPRTSRNGVQSVTR